VQARSPFEYASSNPVRRLDANGYSDEAAPLLDTNGWPVGTDEKLASQPTGWTAEVSAPNEAIYQISLSAQGKSTATLQQGGANAWYDRLDKKSQGKGLLGPLFERKLTNFSDIYLGEHLGFAGGTVTVAGEEKAAALFRFETVFDVTMPKATSSSKRPFPDAQHTITALRLTRTVGDSTETIVDLEGLSQPDGPSGFAYEAGRVIASDAIRLDAPAGEGAQHHLAVDFTGVYTYKETTFQASWRAEIHFSDTSPESGWGLMTITEAPHLVGR
jgi:hypothetical protein